MQTSIHIIGAGLAGWNLAQEVRKLSQVAKITLITADSGDFYNKILLSTIFEKKQTAEDLISQTGIQKAKELNIELIANTKVIQINSQKQKLILADNSQLDYEKLVIATGAYPLKLPFLAKNPKVFFVNSLTEYKLFEKNLKANTKVGILGAGLVGVEFAHDLLNSQVKPYLISDSSSILTNLAPAEVSKPLLNAMEDAGLTTILGDPLKGIKDKGDSLELEFESLKNLEVDILLSAIGLRANISLAESASCAIENGAIKVDKKLATSQKNIYALGDCTSIDGKKLMFVEPLLQSARLLAKNLLKNAKEEQEELALPALPVILKSSRYPLVSAMPPLNSSGSWQIDVQDGGVSAKFFDKNDKILGFALSGNQVRYTNRLAKQLDNLI